MAKILCIDISTYRAGEKELGDVLAYRDDSHVWDVNELNRYKCVGNCGKCLIEKCKHRVEVNNNTVNGTRIEVKTKARLTVPEKAVAWDDGKGKVTLEPPAVLSAEVTRKELWKDGEVWKEIKQRPKFDVNYNSLTRTFQNNITGKLENQTPVTISSLSAREL